MYIYIDSCKWCIDIYVMSVAVKGLILRIIQLHTEI